MSKLLSILYILPFTLLTGCATSGDGAAYTCTAPRLLSGSYQAGATTARIHLSGYSSGGTYRVKDIGGGIVAGSTADGTRFTCQPR